MQFLDLIHFFPWILRDKTMADKLMYISNDDTQNYPFYRLQLVLKHLYTKLNEPTIQNLIKVPKVVKPTNMKTLLFNFGD